MRDCKRSIPSSNSGVNDDVGEVNFPWPLAVAVVMVLAAMAGRQIGLF